MKTLPTPVRRGRLICRTRQNVSWKDLLTGHHHGAQRTGNIPLVKIYRRLPLVDWLSVCGFNGTADFIMFLLLYTAAPLLRVYYSMMMFDLKRFSLCPHHCLGNNSPEICSLWKVSILVTNCVLWRFDSVLSAVLVDIRLDLELKEEDKSCSLFVNNECGGVSLYTNADSKVIEAPLSVYSIDNGWTENPRQHLVVWT